MRYPIGEGEVTLFAVSAYPAHPAVAELYIGELGAHMTEAARTERVWAEATKGTQFALYDRGEEKDVYFLAIDWYRPTQPLRTATLRIGENRHTVSFPFGTMIKASVWEDYAAYPHSEEAEVISVKNGIARIQGTGIVKFTFLNGRNSYEKDIDFTDRPVCEIEI